MSRENFPTKAVGIIIVVAIAMIVLVSIGGLTRGGGAGNIDEAVTVSEVLKLSVTGEEFKYDQSTIEVKKGSLVQVTFTNAGQIIHTFNIQEYGVATGFINSGETATVEFKADREGEFAFFCNVSGHIELGMIGKIVVTP